MQRAWATAMSDLRRLRGDALELRSHTPWDSSKQATLLLRALPGELFDCGHVELHMTVSIGGAAALMLAADDSEQDELPEAVVEAVDGISDALVARRLEASGPVASVRSVLLRLSDELCLELSSHDTAILCNLGRVSEALLTEVADSELLAPPVPLPVVQPLLRLESYVSQATSVAFSLESDGERLEGSPAEAPETSLQPMAAVRPVPRTEDIMLWSNIVEVLRREGSGQVEVVAPGMWDGTEGMMELVLISPEENGPWDRLAVVFIASASGLRVEAKGAQIISPELRRAILEARAVPDAVGVEGLRIALRALCAELRLDLDKELGPMLEVGIKDSSGTGCGMHWLQSSGSWMATSDLEREARAIDALGMQLWFIDAQAKYLECKLADHCFDEDLHDEIALLLRTRVLVAAEKEAGEKAVAGILAASCDTSASSSTAKVVINVSEAQSQSLRGHSVQYVADEILRHVSGFGPWGHYAAFQFSCMLQREQELFEDFICFYHSYSFASLLYEVHAEVARHVFGLPDSFPPLPRLAVPEGAATSAENLRGLVQTASQDHDPAFRALGLSSSCSVFANQSEAPPLTCFQGGYSCTDLDFRSLLQNFLGSCCDVGHQSIESLTEAVIAAGSKHNLPVQPYGAHASQSALPGYMLQIFIHRSIVEQFAYASQPMGIPIDGTIVGYTMSHSDSADGQARVLFHPPTFIDPSKARLFHYCARPLQTCMSSDIPESRGSLVKELRAVLQPVLKTKNEIISALKLQSFGGAQW